MLCECCEKNPAASIQPPGTRFYTPPARCTACKGCAYTKDCVVKLPGYLRGGRKPPPRQHRWRAEQREAREGKSS